VTKLVDGGLHGESIVLVFDGDCGFCTLAASWVSRLDARQRVHLIPCQAVAAVQALGLTTSQCMAAAWAVESSGRLHQGAGAIVMGVAFALDWALLPKLYAFRPLRWALEVGYSFMAKVRRWLPGVTPYCQEHPEECGDSGRG
jgi:predicted DCC family thiol-disulfide oxidoreductase YuxK